jgi:hypothetical protein
LPLVSVRKKRQVEHFRAAFADRVFHLHLNGPEDVLRGRYERRLEEKALLDELEGNAGRPGSFDFFVEGFQLLLAACVQRTRDRNSQN